jgi:hypothetical protein
MDSHITRRPNPYSDLPKIVLVESIDDAGEFGAANCPHCGAPGRYIVSFLCDDGTRRSAMRGCFKHFRRHRFANVALDAMTKETEYKRKGWKLPTWDQQKLDAIRAFAAQEISEWEADRRINLAEAAARSYRKRKYGHR